MKKLIEHPKVFLSYSWSDDEYQESVYELATRLTEHGIKVIFDKWQLQEGNDMYQFMEQCVNDESVTNVLILIDPIYVQRADARKGGVGTETQIITPELYTQVNQNKFIPVIMKKDENGDIKIPAYLKSILYIDLSNEENRSQQYRKLVNLLYGYQEYEEPPLGTKPEWLGKSIKANSHTFLPYRNLKGKSVREQSIMLVDFLTDLKKEVVAFRQGAIESPNTDKEYGEEYTEYVPLRDKILELIKCSVYVERSHKWIADFLNDLKDEILDLSDYRRSILSTYIHELYIYTIAMYMKYEQYDELKDLLTREYNFNEKDSKFRDFRFFYHSDSRLDNYMCNRDKQNYYSGTAEFWMTHINENVCTKEEFVSADIFCNNASLFIIHNTYEYTFYWFPMTYVYGKTYRNFRKLANKLQYKTGLQTIANILGYTPQQFIQKYNEIFQNYKNGNAKKFSYPMAFSASPQFFYYLKPDELGQKDQ